MCKFIMFCLGIMVSPQLLQIVIAKLMLLFLWQLLSGEDLHHSPHHNIILRNDWACYFQYFHGLALCQRCTVLIMSSCFLQGFYFTVWWNANAPLCMILLAVKQSCPVPPLKFWLFWRTLVMHISPWNCSVALYLVFWPKLWQLQRYLWDFLSTTGVFLKINYVFSHFESIPNFSLNSYQNK